MLLLLLLTLYGAPSSLGGETIISHPIRILDSRERQSTDGRESWYRPYREPTKSYVIYDNYPTRWPMSNKPTQDWHLDFNQRTRPRPGGSYQQDRGPPQPGGSYLQDRRPSYQQDRDQLRPTMSYEALYSNTIKVYDDPQDYLNVQRFPKPFGYKRYYGEGQRQHQQQQTPQDFDSNIEWPPQQQVPKYDVYYPYELSKDRIFYPNEKLPENFPNVFSPDSNFHPSTLPEPKPTSKMFYPSTGFYDTHTVNFGDNKPFSTRSDVSDTQNQVYAKNYACNYIRLNEQGFPVGNEGCGRSDDLPLTSPHYPNYSHLPNERIPLEHRLHYRNRGGKQRARRQIGDRRMRDQDTSTYGYSYMPYGYSESYYPSYHSSDNHDNYGRGRNSYMDRDNSPYGNKENEYMGSGRGRPRYGQDRHRDMDSEEEHQSSDETNNRGLTSILSGGGRREKNKRRQNENDDNESNEESSDSEDKNKEKGSRRGGDSKDKNKDDNFRGGGSHYGRKEQDRSEEDSEEDEEDGYRNRNNDRDSKRKGSNRGRSNNRGRYDSYGGSRSYEGRDGYSRNRGGGYRGDYGDEYGGGRYKGSSGNWGTRYRGDGYGSSGDRSYGSYGDRSYGNNDDRYGGYGDRSYGSYGDRSYGSYGDRSYGSYGDMEGQGVRPSLGFYG